MDIGHNVLISWKAHWDKSINPRGIVVGNPARIVKTGVIVVKGKIVDPGRKYNEQAVMEPFNGNN